MAKWWMPTRGAWILAGSIVAASAVWTAYSRWRSAHEWEERLKPRYTLPPGLANELKIETFYASPPVIRAGQTTLLCYGVQNAEAVSLSPPVETIHPSLSRCIEIRPQMTTEYRLTARSKSGRRVEALTTIRVLP